MPVSGVLTSCATPAASRPIDAIFSEICSCSSSRTRSVMSSMSRMRPDHRRRRPMAFCSGTSVALTSSRAESACARRQRHAIERGAVRMLVPRGAAAPRRTARRTSSASVRPIAVGPRRRRRKSRARGSSARYALSASNTTSPSSSDSRMFSLNSRMRPSCSAFRWSCAVQPAVLDRGRDLAGHGGQAAPRSSLLNGSSVSFRPSARTAIARPSNTQGTK